MEIFIFFFFMVIVFNAISSIGKQNKKKAKTRSPWNPGGAVNDGSGSGSAHSQSAKQDHAKAQSARRARQKVRNRIRNRNSVRRDIADNNKSRSYNWGERAGPGFLTMKNILVLMALVFVVLYGLSQMPADLLR